MLFLASRYRLPRRLPRDTSREAVGEPRKRDLIIFLVCLVFFAVILFVASHVAHAFGRPEIGLSLQLVAALFTTATIGVLATVGIVYSLAGAFLKHELDKKFRKMDEEQQALLRRMTGQSDDDEGAA